MRKLSLYGDGSGKPSLAIVEALLETLAQVRTRRFSHF